MAFRRRVIHDKYDFQEKNDERTTDCWAPFDMISLLAFISKLYVIMKFKQKAALNGDGILYLKHVT